MAQTEEITFREVIDALLNVDVPFHPRYLYRLSDLNNEEVKMLEEVWQQVPVWRRQALLQDVETMGERDMVLSFEALARFSLRDSEPGVRLPAIRALWDFEEPDLIDTFIEILENDQDVDVRAAAATALGKYVYLGEIEEIPVETLRRVEAALIVAHTGTSPEIVRRRALEALGFSGREDIQDLIEKAYNSGKRDWVASALYAMGRSFNERWIPLVMKQLDSDHPTVRAEAARAAGELEVTEALPALLEMLDDPDEEVRMACIWSLSQIGGEGVRQRLEQLYEEAEDEEEAEFIDSALDNLSFTEDMELFALFDFPEAGEVEDAGFDEDELLDMIDEEGEEYQD